MPIDTITPAYQPPKIEDKPVDVDANEPDLNMDFEENVSQQEGIIHEAYESQDRNTCRNCQNYTCRLTARI